MTEPVSFWLWFLGYCYIALVAVLFIEFIDEKPWK